MRPRTSKKLISGALLAVVLGSLWFYLAPTAIGGSTSWVVTDGISMEPHFHGGDLVIVRSRSHYQVGEIVAYRNRQLHTIVLHRIVGRDGSRYIFKGDNNNFLDFEHPAQSQLIGSVWLHLAGVGSRLESVRSPLLIGGLFALATLLFAGAAFTGRRRRRRRQRRAEATTRSGPAAPLHQAQTLQLKILAGGLLALLPFACLALLAFTRPSEALLRSEVPYEQRGSLSYAARARPGPVYPGNLARTGDPLFTHVVNLVELTFDYRFESAEAANLSAKITIAASLGSVLGWHRTVPLSTTSTFHDRVGRARATLDLASLLALINSVESSTGLRSTYTLTLTPSVLARGTLGGLAVHANFAPAMAFSLNRLELQPLAPGAGGSSGAAPASDFTRTSTATASGRRSEAMQLSFGILRVPVARARAISLIAIGLITGLLLALLALAKPRRRDESASIRARYGGLIIPVERVWQLPGVAVIDVADIEALVRIAAHYDRSILHERTDYGEAFWVTDESGQFRYWIGTPVPAFAAGPAGAFEETRPEPPTEQFELPHRPVLDADVAPTLEFAAQAPGNGSHTAAGLWSDAWGPTAERESVERVEGRYGVEQGPLLG